MLKSPIVLPLATHQASKRIKKVEAGILGRGLYPLSYETSLSTEVIEKYSKPLLEASPYSQLEKEYGHILAQRLRIWKAMLDQKVVLCSDASAWDQQHSVVETKHAIRAICAVAVALRPAINAEIEIVRDADRLSSQHEQDLRNTQYGFRAGRGTQHPLFILRRAMEWSEMTSTTLHALFLDWKQAFDSIDHNAMMTALKRFGISERAFKIISSLYQDPTFYTCSRTGEKAMGGVGSGIRQGCPLSPYLFIMVLTVILADVDLALLSNGTPTNTWSVGKPIFDLEYADDTLLLALTTTQMQLMLHALEEQADLYGMSLNQTTTELLVDPRRPAPTVRFRNGTEVQTTTLAKYLGSMVAWEKAFEAAFKHRAGIAETNYKKLRLIWNCSLSRKKSSISSRLHLFQPSFMALTLCHCRTNA